MTSMKTLMGLVVIASAIGCGIDPADTAGPTGETGEAAQALGLRCPDPDNCVLSNGGGVYYDELGNAGIGPNDYMITRFVNVTGGGVTIQGRGFTPSTGNFTSRPAGIYYARYNGTAFLHVLQVQETLTVPTFWLVGQSGPAFPVTGLNLLNLQLVVSVDEGLYTISFYGHHADSNSDGNATVQDFDMAWNPGESASPNPNAYCTRAPVYGSVEDPVVFQQGIAINAVTGVMMARNSNEYVTLSCRHGGIATARWWGYVYRNDLTSAQQFASAIQMKRASYCGDETFYTRANTFIEVWDSAGINGDTLDPDAFEASWGMTANGIRAVCVNMNHRRRPGLNWPPNQSGDPFNGTCLDGTQIPDCASGAFGSMADQEAP
jgi:hypothetical protein